MFIVSFKPQRGKFTRLLRIFVVVCFCRFKPQRGKFTPPGGRFSEYRGGFKPQRGKFTLGM